MKLTRLAGGCDDGDCPTLYLTDRGTVAVQGTLMADHGLQIPPDETIAEIPVELIRKVIRDNLIQDTY
ncbi:hypothetical protein AB0H73_33070 [Streptomyces olivoreticuli]|uniref:Uncharacterized protein n=1 Tax=Streptomyces blastmyceticus TaxID=68180 RepID=A0ABN0WJ62_9ACTN|nr:hypothetical protein [Streptomyces olivoreticuli]